MVELGGNIELVGFEEIDGGSMIVVKKVVGNYAKKFSEICKQFQNLKVTLKKVHEREKSEKYELQGKLVNDGKVFNSEMTDMNLFFALDKILKAMETEVKK